MGSGHAHNFCPCFYRNFPGKRKKDALGQECGFGHCSCLVFCRAPIRQTGVERGTALMAYCRCGITAAPALSSPFPLFLKKKIL